MGGLGSGSWQVAKRRLAEQCAVLRVRDVRRCTDEPASVILSGAHRVTVHRMTNAGEEWVVIDDTGQWVPIVTTPQPSGGWRRWFACPGCSARRAALHLPRGAMEWRCRVCHDIAYKSQRLTDPERMMLRARRLRERVRPSIMAEAWAIARGQPRAVKKKGVRWATWRAAEMEADDLEEMALAAMLLRVDMRRRSVEQLMRTAASRGG